MQQIRYSYLPAPEWISMSLFLPCCPSVRTVFCLWPGGRLSACFAATWRDYEGPDTLDDNAAGRCPSGGTLLAGAGMAMSGGRRRLAGPAAGARIYPLYGEKCGKQPNYETNRICQNTANA